MHIRCLEGFVKAADEYEKRKETDREENVMREQQQGLYSPAFEHDNCGIGAVVNSKGIKSHLTVERALHIVENLEHRAEKTQREKPETVWNPSSDFS